MNQKWQIETLCFETTDLPQPVREEFEEDFVTTEETTSTTEEISTELPPLKKPSFPRESVEEEEEGTPYAESEEEEENGEEKETESEEEPLIEVFLTPEFALTDFYSSPKSRKLKLLPDDDINTKQDENIEFDADRKFSNADVNAAIVINLMGSRFSRPTSVVEGEESRISLSKTFSSSKKSTVKEVSNSKTSESETELGQSDSGQNGANDIGSSLQTSIKQIPVSQRKSLRNKNRGGKTEGERVALRNLSPRRRGQALKEPLNTNNDAQGGSRHESKEEEGETKTIEEPQESAVQKSVDVSDKEFPKRKEKSKTLADRERQRKGKLLKKPSAFGSKPAEKAGGEDALEQEVVAASFLPGNETFEEANENPATRDEVTGGDEGETKQAPHVTVARSKPGNKNKDLSYQTADNNTTKRVEVTNLARQNKPRSSGEQRGSGKKLRPIGGRRGGKIQARGEVSRHKVGSQGSAKEEHLSRTSLNPRRREGSEKESKSGQFFGLTRNKTGLVGQKRVLDPKVRANEPRSQNLQRSHPRLMPSGRRTTKQIKSNQNSGPKGKQTKTKARDEKANGNDTPVKEAAGIPRNHGGQGGRRNHGGGKGRPSRRKSSHARKWSSQKKKKNGQEHKALDESLEVLLLNREDRMTDQHNQTEAKLPRSSESKVGRLEKDKNKDSRKSVRDESEKTNLGKSTEDITKDGEKVAFIIYV